MKKIKGITLIALVITIVVLLILAGVSIAMLTGKNGILNKASTAKEKYNENAAREKVQLIISEVIMEQTQNGKKATIDDLYAYILNNDEFQMKKESEKSAIIGTDGYAFRINEKLEIVETVSISLLSNIESTYIINSVNGNNMKVTITISSNTEIETINTPDGNVIYANSNKMATVFDVISGQNYTFKIKLKGVQELKEYILKADTNAKPEISENTTNNYPELTRYGVELNKRIDIDYGEGKNNYYSLDDGKTWNSYTGSIKVKNDGKVIAKTIMENEITKVESKDYTMNLASDALGANAYDGNESTCEQYNYVSGTQNKYQKYMLIEEAVQNSKINIKCSFVWNIPTYVYFYNTEGEKVGTKQLYAYCKSDFELGYMKSFNGVREVEVPNGAVKMEINVSGLSLDAKSSIYEVSIVNQPKLNITENYAKMTVNGFENPYTEVSIDYYETSVQKKYRIGTEGEWKDYTEGKNIRLELGETIQAKGIDKNGNETKISSTQAKLKDDAIGINAYDGNESTCEQYNYVSGTQNKYQKYMLIEEAVQNSKINIKCSFVWNIPTYVYFYNTEGEKVGTKQLYAYCKSDFELGYMKSFNGVREVEVPNGAVKMEINVSGLSLNATSNIYEISKQ